ncbi:MAG: SDR family oxidoreductase [Moraxellaceae bacterium]|nr:SDR family oxidoreductase [Moraxellaceae bacterium]
MAKVLIVGCGDVGGRLATLLAGAGHEVIGLRRSPFVLTGVTALVGDVRDPASLDFPPGLDAVFIVLAPGESGEAAYRATYLEGTRHVLAALAGQRPRQLFWVSSTGVYGQEDGRWVNEDTPPEPVTATGRILLESEALARTAPSPVTVVRLSGLYGPGRLRLVRWVEAGRPVQADPPSWSNRLHVEDAAALLAFLLEKRLSGMELAPVYIGTDSTPAPQHEVLDWLADGLSLPHVAHENRPGGAQNKRLSNQRVSALGFCCRYHSYREGYAAVMGWSDDIR